MSGRKTEALAILQELREQLARGRMTHTSMALVHTALGQVGEAIAGPWNSAGRRGTIPSLVYRPRSPLPAASD